MVRLLFLSCILLLLCCISIAQEYYYEADVADPNLTTAADYSYQPAGDDSRSSFDGYRGTIDPRYETEARTSSRQLDDKYLLKPGVFSGDNRQEKKMQEKVANVTSTTMRILLIFGTVGICVVAFLLNNMR